jgi:hypothetical protein
MRVAGDAPEQDRIVLALATTSTAPYVALAEVADP